MRTYVFKILILGAHSENAQSGANSGQEPFRTSTSNTTKKNILLGKDIDRLQQIIRTVVHPSYISKLRKSFVDTAGRSPMADEWRSLSEIHGPLICPLLWREHGPQGSAQKNPAMLPEELEASMRLFEIISLSLRAFISDIQLARIDALVNAWQRLIFAVHPSLKTATNLHVISHLCEDIRRHGTTNAHHSSTDEQPTRPPPLVSNTTGYSDTSGRANVSMQRNEAPSSHLRLLICRHCETRRSSVAPHPRDTIATMKDSRTAFSAEFSGILQFWRMVQKAQA